MENGLEYICVYNYVGMFIGLESGQFKYNSYVAVGLVRKGSKWIFFQNSLF